MLLLLDSGLGGDDVGVPNRPERSALTPLLLDDNFVVLDRGDVWSGGVGGRCFSPLPLLLPMLLGAVAAFFLRDGIAIIFVFVVVDLCVDDDSFGVIIDRRLGCFVIQILNDLLLFSATMAHHWHVNLLMCYVH